MKRVIQNWKRELTVFFVAILGAILITVSSSLVWYLPVVILILLLGGLFFFVLLKDVSIGVLLITFLLPFEQIGGFNLGGMNVRLSQLVFLVTFATWFLSGLYRRTLKIKLDIKLLLLAIFSIISVASFSYTVNLFRSVQIFVFILFVFAVYIFFSSYRFDQKLFKKLIAVLFVSMVLTCLFGLFQFAGDMIGLPRSLTGLEETYTKAVFGFPRIQSTANEPLNYANYLLLPIGVAFAIFADMYRIGREKVSKDGLVKFLQQASLPVLILSSVVMILTFSRGGWGGMGLIGLILGLHYLKSLLTPQNILLGFVVSVLSISGVFVVAEVTNAPFTFDVVLSRINISDFSAKHRVMTTQEGLEGWEKNPWIGIGLGAYGPYVAKYRNIEPEEGWQTVNNEYAELLIETGIVGVFLICIFWSMFLIEGPSKSSGLKPFDKAVYLGMLAALAGMLLQYISFSTLYVFHLWYLLGILNNGYWQESKKGE